MGRFLGQPLTVRAGNFRTVRYVPVFLFLDDGGDSFRMFAYYYMNGIDMDEVDYGKTMVSWQRGFDARGAGRSRVATNLLMKYLIVYTI